MKQTRPIPSADERAHSAQLLQLIVEVIQAEGGAIAFSWFMELALYAPGLGYYSAGARKLGADGDFVTAPELGSLFAQCVAQACAPVLQALGAQAQWFELGGGSGRFAVDVLQQLYRLDALPSRYAILEPSADLQERQKNHVQAQLPAELAARVEWVHGPMEGDWQGVLFANEVIDALPATCFVIKDGAVWERYVAYQPALGLHEVLRPADGMLTAAVRHLQKDLDAPLAEAYRSEVLIQLPYWMQAITGGLQRGAVLFCDYGYPRREYYAATRTQGTLRGFYRQHVVDDVLADVGLQDITASVDFTALAEAGQMAGLELAGYCNQASFLIANGLQEHLQQAEAACADETARLRLRQQAKTLTLPEAMGERFGVMGFAKAVDFDAPFALGDLSWRL